MRALLWWANHLPKASLPNTYYNGIRFQHMNFGESTLQAIWSVQVVWLSGYSGFRKLLSAPSGFWLGVVLINVLKGVYDSLWELFLCKLSVHTGLSVASIETQDDMSTCFFHEESRSCSQSKEYWGSISTKDQGTEMSYSLGPLVYFETSILITQFLCLFLVSTHIAEAKLYLYILPAVWFPPKLTLPSTSCLLQLERKLLSHLDWWISHRGPFWRN